jgi:hypothetical protein
MDFYFNNQLVLQLLLLISFGLVILIWLVQLIIYPNFQYIPAAELIKWHKIYTPRITVVVAPLMILQLALTIYLSFYLFSTLNLLALGLIVLNWLLTFIYFVPLHVKIDQDNINQTSLRRLVQLNWYRTIIWSCVFFIVLSEYLT